MRYVNGRKLFTIHSKKTGKPVEFRPQCISETERGAIIDWCYKAYGPRWRSPKFDHEGTISLYTAVESKES